MKTAKIYNIKNIDIMVTVDRVQHILYGYVGNEIKKNEGKFINKKIDDELSKMKKQI